MKKDLSVEELEKDFREIAKTYNIPHMFGHAVNFESIQPKNRPHIEGGFTSD